MPRSIPTPLVSIAFVLSFLAYLAAGSGIFSNPDLPWHLMAGDLIRSSGGIPESDPWSFSADGARWYNLAWAWDVLVSLVMERSGLAGLYIFTALVCALIVAALAAAMQKRGGASDIHIVVALMLVWYALLAFFSPRPNLATLLFTVAFHHFLHESRGRNDWRALRWLPPLMVAWVNLHGGFVVGLSLLVIYAVEAHQTAQYAWFRRLCVMLALCSLACLANPYGIFVMEGFLATMLGVVTPHLVEWQPLPVGWSPGPTLLLIFFLLTYNVRDPRVPAADKMAVFLWFCYGLFAQRNFFVFAMLAAPCLAYSIEVTARYLQGARYKDGGILVPDSPAHRFRCFGIALAVAAAVPLTPLQAWIIDKEKLNDDPYGMRPMLAALKPYEKKRFLNDYNIGGYLIYLSGGRWPVFADGRAGTAYPEEVMKDVLVLSKLEEGYRQLADKYHADGIIVANAHLFNKVACRPENAGWKLAYASDTVSAYVRGH